MYLFASRKRILLTLEYKVNTAHDPFNKCSVCFEKRWVDCHHQDFGITCFVISGLLDEQCWPWSVVIVRRMAETWAITVRLYARSSACSRVILYGISVNQSAWEWAQQHHSCPKGECISLRKNHFRHVDEVPELCFWWTLSLSCRLPRARITDW